MCEFPKRTVQGVDSVLGIAGVVEINKGCRAGRQFQQVRMYVDSRVHRVKTVSARRDCRKSKSALQ